MSVRSAFRNPMTWAQLVATILMAGLMTFGYLGAFLSPESNTHDAPFTIVNEDEGVSLGGQTVNFGDQVVQGITAPNPESGDRIEWTILDSRAEAEQRLGEDRDYAAIVIPADYSRQLAALMQASSASTAPQAASIDVLLNSAAGAYPTNLAKSVTTTAVDAVSTQVQAQLVQALGGDSAQIPVALSSVITTPVVANVIDQQPTGPHTAGGNSPFYYALLLMLAGFVGMDILFLGMEMLRGNAVVSGPTKTLRGAAVPLSPWQVWSTRVILSAILAVIGSLVQAWVAVGILGMAVDTVLPLILFGMLAIFASAIFTLLFLTLLGTPGLLLAILAQTFLGAPSARGIFPKEMLPDFYQWVGSVLPLRYITDGVRAIVFYDANGEAGLTQGIVGLAIITVVALIVGGGFAWWQDRRQESPAESVASVAPAAA